MKFNKEMQLVIESSLLVNKIQKYQKNIDKLRLEQYDIINKYKKLTGKTW